MVPILQLTSRGAVAHESLEPVATLAGEFRAHRCAKVPALIEPSLLARIQAQIERSAFFERAHGTIATELCMERNTSLGLLHFLVNDALVFDLVQRVTGVPAIGFFAGRVYRRLPAAAHHDSWHGDVHPDRRVGMSINLSAAPFEGGVFEIRDEDTERPLGAIGNVGPGDALLFAIADGLEHRVTDVRGAVAKTAFAGWFGTTSDYLGTLRGAITQPDARA